MTKRYLASSNLWLQNHFRDSFVKRSQRMGFRSRSWFKLEEMDRVNCLFKSGMIVVDLGSTPGGWSQYAATAVTPNGQVIAYDIKPMNPIIGVVFFQSSFCDRLISTSILDFTKNKKVNVVMSDMSPNFSGITVIDVSRSMFLANLALKVCQNVLTFNGKFIVKVFQGKELNRYLTKVRNLFKIVSIFKPKASRKRSRELYIVAMQLKQIRIC